MLACPACKELLDEPDAWVCPFCDYVLDASVVDPNLVHTSDLGEDDLDEDPITVTGADALDTNEIDTLLSDDPITGTPEAMIVGEINDDTEPPTFVAEKGKGYLFYGTGSWKQNVQAILDAPSTAEPVYPTDMTEDDLGEGVDPSDYEDRSAIDVDTMKLGLKKKPVHGEAGALGPSSRSGHANLPALMKAPEALPLDALWPELESGDLPAPEEPAIREPEIREPEAAKSEAKKLEPAPADLETRAKKLWDQAQLERSRGDLVAAHRNLKLALTFAPTSYALKRLLTDVARELPRDRKSPAKFSQNQSLADRAAEKEKDGDIDGAIELLERALRSPSKDAAVYNRLGVILAIRKKDYVRGREMVERALELSPDNAVYANNLSKILTVAATADLMKGRGGSAGDKKGGGGLLGLFGKKKS
jgi:tetratricopeptide (TPR) repeat protein